MAEDVFAALLKLTFFFVMPKLRQRHLAHNQLHIPWLSLLPNSATYTHQQGPTTNTCSHITTDFNRTPMYHNWLF